MHLEDEPELIARFLELAQSARQEDAPAPGFAPYKGLLFFDESDSELFFGREALTAHLAEHVMDLAMDSSVAFPGSGGRIGQRQIIARARRTGCRAQACRLGYARVHAHCESLENAGSES